MRIISLFGLALVAAGCAVKGPPVLANGTIPQIQAAAVADARADIDKGEPRVCYAGGYAVRAVGVPEEHLRLMESLPKRRLPAGCTDPLAGPAEVYAEAYNLEIVKHLTRPGAPVSDAAR